MLLEKIGVPVLVVHHEQTAASIVHTATFPV